jgi:hypothetical protein
MATYLEWYLERGPIIKDRDTWANPTTIAGTYVSGVVQTLHQKTSVDEGSFEPNVYRVNPYHIERIDSDAVGSMSLSYECSAGPYTYSGSENGVLGPLLMYKMPTNLPLVTYEGKLALQKAYRNVDKAVLQVLVELGEFRETIQMLTHPMKALRDFCVQRRWKQGLRELKRYLETGTYRGNTGRKALDAATGAWMEYRYGMRPLISSIESIVKLVQGKYAKLVSQKRIMNARGQVIGPVESETLEERSLVYNSGYIRHFADIESEQQVEAFASVQYRLIGVPTWDQLLGLDWTNLPEAAWELTRCSFVGDWLLDIGSWLSAFKIRPNVEILGNTVGIKRSIKLQYVNPIWQHTVEDIFRSDGYTLDGTVIWEDYQRTVDESRGGPQFVGGELMSLFQDIDALILIWQRFK